MSLMRAKLSNFISTSNFIIMERKTMKLEGNIVVAVTVNFIDCWLYTNLQNEYLQQILYIGRKDSPRRTNLHQHFTKYIN